MLPSNVAEFEEKKPPPQKPGPRVSGGLVVTLVLLMALIGMVAFAVTRLPTTAPARPVSQATPAAAANAAGAGAPADAATEQAIKDVIRRLDEAQAEAIATDNPQVMAATATPEFYAEEVAQNQELVAGGVTEIKLLNMEWGDILVNGNSATAAVYETWSTTFDDGTTEQSRDRNVYTLVKDASGAWKVQTDDHPDAR